MNFKKASTQKIFKRKKFVYTCPLKKNFPDVSNTAGSSYWLILMTYQPI